MTSFNFFRQSLFPFNDDASSKPPDNQILTPWTSHEAIPTEASKRETLRHPPPLPIPETHVKRRPSNLLPDHALPVKEICTLPLVGRAEVKLQKSQARVREVPIQEWIAIRRYEKEKEETLHRKSIEIIKESLENSFLGRRGRKGSRTIDIHRDLYQPMQIYRRQQIVEIVGEKRREVGSSLGKYLPIKSERYHL